MRLPQHLFIDIQHILLAFISFSFLLFFFFFFNDTATTEIYTLSLHDALPILIPGAQLRPNPGLDLSNPEVRIYPKRSEEHTSELQSQSNLVCRLLLEKKKKKQTHKKTTSKHTTH